MSSQQICFHLHMGREKEKMVKLAIELSKEDE
jgi:hypothetical protein